MKDISHYTRVQQKRLFWILGLLAYVPIMLKLILFFVDVSNINFPLTEQEVNLYLVLLLLFFSLMALIYIFFAVSGPFQIGVDPFFRRHGTTRTRSFRSSDVLASRRNVSRHLRSSRITMNIEDPKEKSKTPLVSHCEYCDEKVYLPYHCRRCNGIFCDLHRLPERHRCPFL